MQNNESTMESSRPAAGHDAASGEAWTGQKPGRTGMILRKELLAQLLAENIDDFMSLGFFAHLISTKADAPAHDLRRHCIGYLDHLLRGGYLVVGTLIEDRFVAWILDAAQTQEAISRQWPEAAGSDYGSLRDIGWLLNTPQGNGVAKNYLDWRNASLPASILVEG